jgi:signal transduction histidine kinase
MRARFAALPLLDIALGLVVGIFGIARVFAWGPSSPGLSVLIAIGMGTAVGLYRRAPLIALGLVWLTAILQVVAGLDIALVQLGAVVVAYGTSRYGSRLTVVLSIVSVPLGAMAAVLYAAYVGPTVVRESGLWQLLQLLVSATDLGYYNAATGLLVGFVVVTALLAAPWALGLVLRLRDQSRHSAEQRREAEAETARAQQLAELRAGQTRLARDVHDVVGHSLAVIIAQADSTLAMGDDEIGRIRTAVANIGETARRSLGDVRFVLSDDPAAAGAPRDTEDFMSLIEGVRGGGTGVELESHGVARPLPPELEVVAYRTLQELLTNALKHGVADAPIEVDVDWRTDELQITTRNAMADAPGPGGGTGLEGVHARLQSVGGSLESGVDAGRWTATARVPVRQDVPR